MRLRITVNADGNHFAGGASIVVAEPLVEAFKPIKTASDPFVAGINGELMRGSYSAQRAIRLREDAAKEIAEALTKHLIYEMSKHDTYNGYPNAAQSATPSGEGRE